jgi:hypothetical protein
MRHQVFFWPFWGKVLGQVYEFCTGKWLDWGKYAIIKCTTKYIFKPWLPEGWCHRILLLTLDRTYLTTLSNLYTVNSSILTFFKSKHLKNGQKFSVNFNVRHQNVHVCIKLLLVIQKLNMHMKIWRNL